MQGSKRLEKMNLFTASNNIKDPKLDSHEMKKHFT